MSRKNKLPPAPRPRKLRCVSTEKGVVAEAELEPQITAPDVMRWGSRVFVLSEVQPKPDKVVIYREATQRRIPKPRRRRRRLAKATTRRVRVTRWR